MRSGILSVLALLLLVLATSVTQAIAVPVSIDLTGLRCIQTYDLNANATEPVYLLVDGVAAGKEFTARYPEGSATFTAGRKKLAVDEKKPVTLWNGNLASGQFALLTVTTFIGSGADHALTKKFEDQLHTALQSVQDRARPTTGADGAKAMSAAVVKAEQAVISNIKESFSRDKNTDHYMGLFNVLVWTENGKVLKRVDPVGLTFGEHYGNDVKIYTKLKNTRPNVLVQDATGEWSTQQLLPVSEDNKTLRVKMLETEIVTVNGSPQRKTTDYLAEIQVKFNGQPQEWDLRDEIDHLDDIHTYWIYAD